MAHQHFQTTDVILGFGLSSCFSSAADAEITEADYSATTVLIADADATLLSSFYSCPYLTTTDADVDANQIIYILFHHI